MNEYLIKFTKNDSTAVIKKLEKSFSWQFTEWVLFAGIPEGGLVPKSYYMSPQDFEKDQSPGPHLTDSSCYQSISLNKSQVC